MISRLILKNRDINARLEQILKKIVGWAFKPEALFPRIDGYEKMLTKDIEWGYSIDRSRYPVELGTLDRVKKPQHKPKNGGSDAVDAFSASNSGATGPGAVVGLIVSMALVVSGIL
ncbi:hypothetical protein BGX34_008722 [Mortierella sp. NVP85]|nr:hypothetical protein BGX34_008722 [Mortierella sp. NVP85]